MQLIGYARVSTPEQSLDRQLDELIAHGCSQVFADSASGKCRAIRPKGDACMSQLSAGNRFAVVEFGDGIDPHHDRNIFSV